MKTGMRWLVGWSVAFLLGLTPLACYAAEFGFASWYGYPFHGRQAADGSIYDMEQITAAHKTLPLGSWVRVTNLKNGKVVDVRITDRGPFIDGRVIDLSRAAARAIDVIDPGTAPVRVEVLQVGSDVFAPAVAAMVLNAVTRASLDRAMEDVPVPPPPARLRVTYAVQVGAFQDRKNAEAMQRRMDPRLGSVRIQAREGLPVIWRVIVGGSDKLAQASQLVEQVRASGVPAVMLTIAAVPAAPAVSPAP